MANNLKDKVCVITGGAMGIGFGIADSFLQHGAKTVIVLDIDQEKGDEAAANLSSKHGGRIHFYKCDVTKDLEEVWGKIIETFNNVDMLVNNAGCLDEQNPRRTIEVNILAVINWSLKFWEHARTDKNGNGGTIINMASVCGYRIAPFAPMYQASKFAVMGFTKTMGHPYNFEKYGVRVVAICPGFTKTKLVTLPKPWSGDEDFEKGMKMVPVQEVEDVANAIFEVLENAQSGTAWEIEGALPIVEV